MIIKLFLSEEEKRIVDEIEGVLDKGRYTIEVWLIHHRSPNNYDMKRDNDNLDELEEINNVNQRLDSLHTQLTSIPQSDKEALFRYLPDKVDEVQVLKDLTAMVRDSRLLLSGLTYDGASSGKDKVAGATSQPFVHTFSLNFLSSYSQMKEFLLRLERNDYPLVVSSLSASPNEGGLIDVSLTLLTYAHNE